MPDAADPDRPAVLSGDVVTDGFQILCLVDPAIFIDYVVVRDTWPAKVLDVVAGKG